MKATLKVPLYVLLIFLSVLAVLGLLDLLHVWGSRFDPQNPEEGYVITATIVTSLRDMLPASVFVSIVVVLFLILRRAGSLVLSLVLAGITAFAILVGGFAGLDGLATTLRPEFQGDSYTIPDNQFLSFPGADIYVGSVRSLNVSPVVVFRWDQDPGYSLYDSGVRDPVRNEILVPEAGAVYPIAEAQQAYVALLSPPPFLRPFFSHMGVMRERLSSYRAGDSLLFVLSTFSLVLVFLSTWCFVRLTRWPLFNLLLVLGFMRLVLLAYALLEGEFFRELAIAVVNPGLLEYASPALLTIVSLVLLSVSLLLSPFDQWRREMAHMGDT